MAPISVSKALSGPLSPTKRAHFMNAASPSTPQRSPIKKRKAGISLQQKKALIENLRLEITERARRLRAQYHLQAQGLKSRIEIRVNRIPMALRKLKMEDLLLKYMDQEQQQPSAAPRAPPSPVPIKEAPPRPSPPKPSHQVTRPPNMTRYPGGLSNAIVSDKENDVEIGENKRRLHGNDATSVQPTQILSPTSSNSRLANRERTASPTKPLTKMSSPVKPHGAARSAVTTSKLSKAKTARTGGVRKVTTGSIASSTSSGTSGSSRVKRTAAPHPPAKVPESKSTTRITRRASSNSETSESSNNAVARKGGVKGAITATKKAAGVTKKGEEAKSSEMSKVKSATGRMLRKRA